MTTDLIERLDEIEILARASGLKGPADAWTVLRNAIANVARAGLAEPQARRVRDLRCAKWLDPECADAGACQSLKFKSAAPQPAQAAEPLCQCGDRPAGKCPGEWEPGCDLGANAKFVRVHHMTDEENKSFDAALRPAQAAKVCPECNGPLQWRCPACRIAQSEEVADSTQRQEGGGDARDGDFWRATVLECERVALARGDAALFDGLGPHGPYQSAMLADKLAAARALGDGGKTC